MALTRLTWNLPPHYGSKGSFSLLPHSIGPFLSYVGGVSVSGSATAMPLPGHGAPSSKSQPKGWASLGLGPASSLWTCSVITSPDSNTDLQDDFLASSSGLPHHHDIDPDCWLNLSTISRSVLLTLLGNVGQGLAKNALRFPPWPWLNFHKGAEPWQIRSGGFAHCYITICWRLFQSLVLYAI